MRVLHLIDDAGPAAHPATFALMAQSIGRLGQTQQHTVLLGSASAHRMAVAAGLADLHRVRSAYGLGLRRSLPESNFDIVHCWSVRCFSLAALMFRQTPRLLTLTVPAATRTVHWLRMICQEGGRAAVLPISATLRRSLIAGGVPESAVHVVRPGIDFGAVPHQQRSELRERWGVADDVTVVAMLADPPTDAHAVFGLRAVMLAADATNRPIRLLVHPTQRRRIAARRLARPIGRIHWMADEPDLASPWRVLPGCDIALVVGEGAGNLSLLWAMAANVPIIGEATYATSEIVEDRHSALLAKPDRSPRMIAHRITQLCEDKQLAWKLKDTARHEAFSFFSRQHYCHTLETIYAQFMEARPIVPPQMEITGGLRFTGRA